MTGTGVIVLSPTRELSMQTFGVLKELMKHHHHTYGLVMGGANRSTEAQKLSKGKNFKFGILTKLKLGLKIRKLRIFVGKQISKTPLYLNKHNKHKF